MAISLEDEYPGQVITGDAGYPHGRPRNDIVDGDGSGTPLEETWVADLHGFLQALIEASSITPSGTPDNVNASQYLEALETLFPAIARMSRAEGRLGGADGSAEWLYTDEDGDPAPKDRTLRLVATHFRARTTATATYASGAGGGGVLTLTSNGGFHDLALDRLPHGAVVTAVRMLVEPGAARSGSNRMQLFLERRADMSFEPTVSGGSEEIVTGPIHDDESADLQVVESGVLSEPVLATVPLFLTIRAGNTAGSDNDLLYGVEVDYTDPGPRNF